jgi:hypothetical protein
MIDHLGLNVGDLVMVAGEAASGGRFAKGSLLEDREE